MSLATATTTTRCHSPCVIDPRSVIHITYPAAIFLTIITCRERPQNGEVQGICRCSQKLLDGTRERDCGVSGSGSGHTKDGRVEQGQNVVHNGSYSLPRKALTYWRVEDRQCEQGCGLGHH